MRCACLFFVIILGLWAGPLLAAPVDNSAALTPVKVRAAAPPITAGISYWENSQGLPDIEARFPDQHWWERYQDPQLTRLIEKALLNNLDLRMAAYRIKAAEANAGIILAREFPTLTAAPGFTRQRNSATLLAPNLQQFGLGGNTAASAAGGGLPTGQTTTPLGGNLFAPGRTINIYQAPLRLNYELDILRRNWTAYQIDRLGTRLSQLDQRALTLSLVTDVATQYVVWQHAAQQLALNSQLQDNLKRQLALTDARLTAGLDTRQPLLQVQQTLADLDAQRPPLIQAQALAARRLGVLLGQPTSVNVQPTAWPWAATGLSVGVPSDLLRHRPDILQAETRLAQQGLNVSLARKQFFPTLTLTGQFGYASTRLKDLFRWDSHLLSYGGSLSQDLFNGGAKIQNLRRQKALQLESILSYQNSLLLAFQEVETALANYKTALSTAQQVAVQADCQAQQVALLQAREAQGLLPATEVLPAERQAIQLAQRSLQEHLNRYQAELTLYKALGGGY